MSTSFFPVPARPALHFLLAGWLLLAACAPLPAARTPTPAGPVTITIEVDGVTRAVELPRGLTVREALAQAGVSLGELDRLAPPPYTLISDGLAIGITRIAESFETEQQPLPYSSQIIRNEAIPEGERRLLQIGAPGVEELTYRTVYENGIQVSRSIVRRVTLTEPVAEIIMVGSQGSFTLVPISGTLAYLNGWNAWAMRGHSGQRLPLTSSGDLDGQVFDLSPDGQWLLFTRAVTDPAAPVFNTLWAISTQPISLTAGSTTTRTNPVAMQLPVSNVLYAEWSPVEARTFAYSTAEPIPRAPGWQANNDLWLMRWDDNLVEREPQTVFTGTQLLDTSSGGVYGWWGTGYAFAPDGRTLAYARADSVGLVAFDTYTPTFTYTVVSTVELARFTAYNSHADWAWYPRPAWAPGGELLFTAMHGEPLGLEAAEDSPVFDLVALPLVGGYRARLVPRAGMFTHPVASPGRATATGESAYTLAFLGAIDPNNSPASTYRLAVMDRDGSNVRFLFPPEGQAGLAPGSLPAWSPDGQRLALAYAGNLWLVDVTSGLAQQLTGDGLSTQPQWAP